MSDSHQHTPGTPSDDVVENVVHAMPVVLPIVWMDDATMALHTSRGITLVMLFLCGTAFARYAGHRHPMRIGLVMAALGTLLSLAVMALGG